MTTPTATSAQSPLRYWTWILLATAALFVAIKAIPFVTTNTDFFDPIFRDKYARNLPIVLAHGASAILALALGPFQFMPIASRFGKLWHRRVGYVYLSCILVGGVTGFYMGTIAFGGISPKIAFTSFAVGWLATGWLALDSARQRDFQQHRAWMIRNYALTFGAAMLRINLNVLQAVGFDFVAIYPWLAWASWLPNILFAEWLIRRDSDSARASAQHAAARP